MARFVRYMYLCRDYVTLSDTIINNNGYDKVEEKDCVKQMFVVEFVLYSKRTNLQTCYVGHCILQKLVLTFIYMHFDFGPVLPQGQIMTRKAGVFLLYSLKTTPVYVYHMYMLKYSVYLVFITNQLISLLLLLVGFCVLFRHKKKQ